MQHHHQSRVVHSWPWLSKLRLPFFVAFLSEFIVRKASRRPSRERFLLPNEWRRVRSVLDAQSLKIKVYFYLLLLAGPRMSEARLMQWDHVDLTEGWWYKPRTKSGHSHVLPLSAEICRLLDQLPRDSQYIFHGDPANGKSKPHQPWSRRVVFAHWQKIRRQAHLEDVTIHDLRRTFGSWMMIHGENLPTLQRLMNHRHIQTTMIYARLDQTAARSALTRHAARMLAGHESLMAAHPGEDATRLMYGLDTRMLFGCRVNHPIGF